MNTITIISEKKRLIALLLVLFLGGLGVHRMYVGKVASGIVQLVLTITWVGMLISAPWVFVDFMLIAVGSFKDKRGAVVKEWE